jgi:phytoene dehydrogenase-like protein
MAHYYTHGSMYPKKGTTDIIESLASTINHFGGALLTKVNFEYMKINLINHF